MASLRRSSRLSSANAANREPEGEQSAVATPATKRTKAAATATAAKPRQPRKRKSEAALVAKPDDAEPSAPAETEPKKRRLGAARASTPEPPATTTTIPILPATPVSKPRHSAVARLADPEGTNAPLLSPETSRLIAQRNVADLSPLKKLDLPAASSKKRITTENILQEALAHLVAVDARMKPLVDAHHCRVFSPEGLAEKVDPFESLASSIISQQVSGAAARSIKGRFVALYGPGHEGDGGEGKVSVASEKSESVPGTEPESTFVPSGVDGSDGPGPERFPHPSQVAGTSIERLRTAGLSQRKAEYIQGLAAKFVSGELTAQLLAEAPYETLVEKLVAVRGLGQWSVEMFAMFGLKRMDVFSTGDLGVQRGMAAFVGRDVAKLKAKGGLSKKWRYMTGDEMEALAEPFKPYRSVFMWYMWRVEETDVSTMEL